jgi:chemotaxis protein CheD
MRRPFVYLKPGELCYSEIPTRVSTILGSCVAVTMFDPVTKVGSICHAMLPRVPSSREGEPFRYVDSAILHMLDRFRALGMRMEFLEVKVFGGADVLEHRSANGASVGRQNIETALDTIDKAGLRIIVSDVGGKVGRKLHFHTHTGEVFLRRMRGSMALEEEIRAEAGVTAFGGIRR